MLILDDDWKDMVYAESQRAYEDGDQPSEIQRELCGKERVMAAQTDDVQALIKELWWTASLPVDTDLSAFHYVMQILERLGLR
jgi:hypothetical protein